MPSQLPAITVAMAVYNAEPYLSESIESILNQSFTNFELLIIDDGSTDQSKRIIQSYSDARIRVIYHEKNCGIAFTRTEAIVNALGSLIAWMDADDISTQERLMNQWKAFQENEKLVLCASGSHTIFEFGQVIECTSKIGMPNEALKAALFFSFPFNNATVCFKRDAVLDFLNIEQVYTQAEDYILYATLIDKGDFIRLAEPLLYYRIHESDSRITNDRNNAAIVQGRMIAWKIILEKLNTAASIEILRIHDFITYYPQRIGPNSKVDLEAYLEFLLELKFANLGKRVFDVELFNSEIGIRMYNTALHPAFPLQSIFKWYPKFLPHLPGSLKWKLPLKKLRLILGN